MTNEITFFCNNNNCIVVSINFDKKFFERGSARENADPKCHECDDILCTRKF